MVPIACQLLQLLCCLLLILLTKEAGTVAGSGFGFHQSYNRRDVGWSRCATQTTRCLAARGGGGGGGGDGRGPYNNNPNNFPPPANTNDPRQQPYTNNNNNNNNNNEPPVLPEYPPLPDTGGSSYWAEGGTTASEPPFPGEENYVPDLPLPSSSLELPPPPPLPPLYQQQPQRPQKKPNSNSNYPQQQQKQQQQPPPLEEKDEEDLASWKTTGNLLFPNNSNNHHHHHQNDNHHLVKEDLSSFDKEYILRGLARLYRKKVLPLELATKYGHFHSPPLSPSDFEAPPMILLLGQYSVGKTSFCQYLLGRDFPGSRVGPEPTTDRFTAILWGKDDKIIPGAALCSQTDRPFTGLSPFGNHFLSRLEGTELNAPILRNVTIIDTPGILSGQKQKSRNYDYEAVMRWFAERADLIIVMFDAHKLDISDELKSVMQLMIPHLDKVRIVLNKADSISSQQLMRVYGALMWSLGKVLHHTPEVSRVTIGSFWEAPYRYTEQSELLQAEELDLLRDIMALPQHAVMRKINELVKRARSVKVHAYIIHYLRKQMPSYQIWKSKTKQQKLIRNLEQEFLATARRYNLPKGDFPSLEPMRQALMEIKDLNEFPKLDKRLVREMDKVFSIDIPELLEKAKNH